MILKYTFLLDAPTRQCAIWKKNRSFIDPQRRFTWHMLPLAWFYFFIALSFRSYKFISRIQYSFIFFFKIWTRIMHTSITPVMFTLNPDQYFFFLQIFNVFGCATNVTVAQKVKSPISVQLRLVCCVHLANKSSERHESLLFFISAIR